MINNQKLIKSGLFLNIYLMKRLKRAAIVIILIFITGHCVFAQSYKFGHINGDEIIQLMPEFEAAKARLENLYKELSDYLEIMSVELNTKYSEYMRDSKNYSVVLRQVKEQELSDMNRRIQEFQTTAQTHFQEKQSEFFQPVYEKIDRAIKDVGRENGFIYIFDTSQGDLLFFDESKSTDVTALVKTKLNIE